MSEAQVTCIEKLTVTLGKVEDERDRYRDALERIFAVATIKRLEPKQDLTDDLGGIARWALGR